MVGAPWGGCRTVGRASSAEGTLRGCMRGCGLAVAGRASSGTWAHSRQEPGSSGEHRSRATSFTAKKATVCQRNLGFELLHSEKPQIRTTLRPNEGRSFFFEEKKAKCMVGI